MAPTLPNTHVVNTSRAFFYYQQSFTYGITGGMVLLSHATRFTRGKDVERTHHETIYCRRKI